ncbi:bifunctional DNA-formamidopyrimidine glycosylase/DNA-(apurinic or apyrimidinic site) lyase [Candidatus Margulisiibacteriota bacterium]
MPELPEVETVKRGLAKALKGKRIADFDCDWHKMINLPLARYKKLLKGLRVREVRRRAKMIIMLLDRELQLMFHLKMTGQLVFGGHPNKFTHATFTFTDNSNLFFNDVRKFGWVRLYNKKELAQALEKMDLGPEPFDKEFSPAYLLKVAQRRPKAKVKQFIMDPQVVVGVGNIYSDEVCYFAKVRPDRQLKTLKDNDLKSIHKGILKILTAAIKAQGTTFSNYVNADGEAGAYTRKLKVYSRYGKKCYHCKAVIKRMKIGGRTSSFCPKCQK